MASAADVLKILLQGGVNLGGGAVNLFNRIGTGQAIYGAIERYFDNLSETISHYRSIDAEAAKYVQALGGGARALQTLSNTSLKAAHDLEISKKYNISTEDLIKAQAAYASALGRNVHVFMGQRDDEGNLIEGTSDMENLAAMTKVLGESTTPMLEGMDLFGISIDGASKRAAKMHNDATRVGISFAKYSDTIVKNFALAQKYTFRDGLRGLENMARKATELKMDMSQVAAFADKVGTVEGSVSVASKLQVLGGPFAQFADPLGMLNESLNDMGGLQDRMIEMFKNLGTFNRNTGEIEFGAFERRQIREAATAMGIDYGNVLTQIQQSTRRNEIEEQINQARGTSSFSPEFRELVKNIGTFKNGQAVVTDGDKEYTMEQLASDTRLQEELMSKYQDEGQDIKDIASSVRSIDDIIKGFLGQISVGQAWGEAAKAIDENGRTIVQKIMDFTMNLDQIGISANELGEATYSLKAVYEWVLEKLGTEVGPHIQRIPEYGDLVGNFLNDMLQKIGTTFNIENIPQIPENLLQGTEASSTWFGSANNQIQTPIRPEYSGEGGQAIVRKYGGFVDTDNQTTSRPEESFKAGQTIINKYATFIDNAFTKRMDVGGHIFGESHEGPHGGVPILAEGGEFIVNTKAMEEYGPLVEAINNQGLKKYASGGWPTPEGPKLGDLDFSEGIFNLDATNSEILKDIDITIKSINESLKLKIKPSLDNTIDIYKVKPTEDSGIYGNRFNASDKPLDINLNIKLSDLNVKSDGNKKLNVQDLLEDNRFTKAVKEMIIAAVTKGNESEIVDRQRNA